MKAIVEWGSVKNVMSQQVCGISGSCQMPTAKKAEALAKQLAHTTMYGQATQITMCEVNGTRYTMDNGPDAPDFLVSLRKPRVILWDSQGINWICVSALDGINRGAYAAIAHNDAESAIKISTEAASLGFQSDHQMELHQKWIKSAGTRTYLDWATKEVEKSAVTTLNNSIELLCSDNRKTDFDLGSKGHHFIGAVCPSINEEIHVFYDKEVKNCFGPLTTFLIAKFGRVDAFAAVLEGKTLVGHIIHRGAKVYIFLDT